MNDPNEKTGTEATTETKTSARPMLPQLQLAT